MNAQERADPYPPQPGTERIEALLSMSSPNETIRKDERRLSIYLFPPDITRNNIAGHEHTERGFTLSAEQPALEGVPLSHLSCTSDPRAQWGV